MPIKYAFLIISAADTILHDEYSDVWQCISTIIVCFYCLTSRNNKWCYHVRMNWIRVLTKVNVEHPFNRNYSLKFKKHDYTIWTLFSYCSPPYLVQFQSILKIGKKGIWLDLDWTWYGECIVFEQNIVRRNWRFRMLFLVLQSHQNESPAISFVIIKWK